MQMKSPLLDIALAMNEITYRARAPLRLGLAGGGTDVSPYSDDFGGLILNVAIDKFAYATILPRGDGLVEFYSADNDVRLCWEAQPVCVSDIEGIQLHKGVYNRIVKDFNGGKSISIDLVTHSEAPPGSGLGSSSAIVVALIKVFCEYLDLPLGEYDIAKLAYEIERDDLNLAGGRQDQYSAAFGGLNFMEFKGSSVIVNPLNIKVDYTKELESSLLLFYTGRSRSSANIIDQQSRNVRSGNEISINALHRVKSEALRMKQALITGDFETFVDSMRVGWNSKKKMAESISNDLIDEIYDSAIAAGALAGRVSGAGGGGFMIFFVDLAKRAQVLTALSRFNGDSMTCNFYWEGASSWRRSCLRK